MKILKRGAAVVVLVIVLLLIWAVIRGLNAPSIPEPSAAARAHAEAVEILRDQWGVPHIYGKRDADTAFGLAYANAEDDYPLIQGIYAASRGQLGLHKPGKRALAADFYAGFADVEAQLAAEWPSLDPHVKEVFEGYAEGLNFYAWNHPEQADPRLLPFTGEDIGRGFIHKLPLMLGVDKVLQALGDEPQTGEPVFPGSNSHAIAPWRSADGITRLNINSHQPWEGPVAWYEAHVHSQEGWNAVGGTFPGAPLIIHGHNQTVGWAMTVNRFDAIDVFELEVEGDRYRFDGGWKTFEERSFSLPLDTPWGTVWIPQTVRQSEHGPVFEKGSQSYAMRWVGGGHGLGAAEQWFALNKAQGVKGFQKAMDAHHIPMFNFVYADQEHIGFVYNGLIPERTPGHDYTTVLPGDDPSLLWKGVLPYLDLPQVVDPASGFLQACNSDPWFATLGPEAPKRSNYPQEQGIRQGLTNRTARTLELLAGGQVLSREDLLKLKWDQGLAKDSAMQRKLLNPLQEWAPSDPDLQQARQILLEWDGRFNKESPGAAIAALAWQPRRRGGDDVLATWALEQAVHHAVEFLNREFGRVKVPLGEVQRLRRGAVDLPLGGGPDILNCTYSKEQDGRLVGHQGDSYVMVVEFPAEGVRSMSIHQYGSSNRPNSPHYADQASLFLEQKFKPVLFTQAEIEGSLEERYHPGGEGKIAAE